MVGGDGLTIRCGQRNAAADGRPAIATARLGTAVFGGALVAAMSIASSAAASGYCEGFAAGWKAAFQNAGKIEGILPICPIPPIGLDTFHGGYQAGMLAALSKIGR